jgi:hypothetical protein
MAWKARIDRIYVVPNGANAEITVYDDADPSVSYPETAHIPTGSTLQDARDAVVAAALPVKTRHQQAEALLAYVGTVVSV